MTITNPSDREFEDLADLQLTLIDEGCRACSLGFQEGLNGCCVSRGNPLKRRMIIGEAPGRFEDAQSSTFVGPAGQLWDKIMESVGWSDKDWYITNVVLCRPIAPKGSGKENFTPRAEQRNKCYPYLNHQISFIRPKIIVTLGKPATETILGFKGIRIGDYRGRLTWTEVATIHGRYSPVEKFYPKVFPMLHPAAILHASSQPEKYELYRQQMWDDIRTLKKLVEEEKL